MVNVSLKNDSSLSSCIIGRGYMYSIAPDKEGTVKPV